MMDNILFYRLATPDDLGPVYAVYREVCLWLNDVRGITDQWERDLPKQEIEEMVNSGQLYIALLQGEVAGGFKLNEQDHHWENDGRALYVHAFAVNRKFKGQGVGRAMLDWAVGEAYRRGKQYVRLDCMNKNPRLKQVYTDAGFEFWGIDPQHAWSALFEKKVEKEMLTQTLQHKTLIAAPAGYTWRPYRREDVPALYEMLMAVDRADARHLIMTLQDMETQYDDPWSNAEMDSLLAFTPDGQVAAMARVFANPEPIKECRAHLMGEVHPAHRGNELEDFVFSWLEARGCAKLREMPFGYPRVLRSSVQDDLRDRIALLERHDFRPARYFYRMRRDLSQPIPDGAPPEGITLRTYCPELGRGMLQAFNESFADHWGFEPVSEHDWDMFFLKRADFRPDLTFAALQGDEVVGFSFNVVNRETNERYSVQEGWVSDLGVRRAWRKRGIASALLCASMRTFKAAGLDDAMLGVDTENSTGALRLYERLGFIQVKRLIAFEKPVGGSPGADA
jgi:ribosomal protein S18 acetylase RimI-like enzyme